MTLPTLTAQLAALAVVHPEVVVLWLYGSRAKGNVGSMSDWDLAVAFDPVKLSSLLDNRLRPELLALDWQRALGLSEGKLSIVDANRVLYCRDQGRRLREEGRIMSEMEFLLSQQANEHKKGWVSNAAC